MAKYIGDHIKAVILDFDDTLVGTIKAKWAQHKFVAEKYYNTKLTDEQIKEHWGKPISELLGLLYGTTEVEQAVENYAAHHDAYPKQLFKETVSLLEKLHKQGKLVGVVTATNVKYFSHDLEVHKIPRELFDYIQTEDDTKYHKPDPRVFEPAIQWLASKDVRPDEVIYIGDGLHDMTAALGAGFSFLGVETGLVTAQQFKDANGRSIPSIADLLAQE